MKFGYDSDGKLVPIEQIELERAMRNLEVQLDAVPMSERPAMVARLRSALTSVGRCINSEDESVLSLFVEGVLDFHNVEHHFGQDLVRAAMGQFGSD